MRLLSIIDRYLQNVGCAVSSARGEFGCENLLAARRSGTIPKSGVLRDGWNFNFHGVGCRFEREASAVDVDFGPFGRSDGFDAWRIWRFAQESLGMHDLELAQVSAELAALKTSGTVVAPSWDPSPHLYYLSEAVDAGNGSKQEHAIRKDLALGG